MHLLELLQQVTSRFVLDNPNAPSNEFIFGFIASDQDQAAVAFNQKTVRLVQGVRDAQYIIYAPYPVFEALFNPSTPNRAEWVEQISMRPDYPFNNYLLSIFLNTFDLEIPDLDYAAKHFEGPFPFPPRYPAMENSFRFKKYQPSPLPIYDAEKLPQLIADNHPEWVAMYNRAWQLAFKNLRQPEPTSGFIANFIDPAFNANTYLWDSCFMTLFGHYASDNFTFLNTLDNFYAKQHDDGFICREINTYSGSNLFQPLDPRSTGPNIFAWTEWQHYQHNHDLDRLRRVFPVLIAHHLWWRDWRTHPNGSYWTSGWGSGMDNQTRIPHSEYHHRGYAWIDANMQQALNCHVLIDIANKIGRDEFNTELLVEYEMLKTYINTHMWDETSGFYFDLAPDGHLSDIKSIGAYWGLLSDVVPEKRAARMITHLHDQHSFNRPHRIPTQSYDSRDYNPYGGYWLGGVWSPTNYMVLQGLTKHGYHDLAFEIAYNHIENVAIVFKNTGTLWENYSPEYEQPGKPSGKDFVGWTGLSAINIPIEHLLGIRVNNGTLIWDIRLKERHGILNLTYQQDHKLNLICEHREHDDDIPVLTISTRKPFVINVRWKTHQYQLKLDVGEHQYMLKGKTDEHI